MSASFEIELSDLTEDAVRRLLKDAIRQQSINSMPAGKRKKAMAEMESEGDEEDEGSMKAVKDNDAKVAIGRKGVAPSLPGVKGSDLPKGIKAGRLKRKK